MLPQRFKKRLIRSLPPALYALYKDWWWRAMSLKEHFSPKEYGGDMAWYSELPPSYLQEREGFRTGDLITGFKYFSRKFGKIDKRKYNVRDLRKTGIVLRLSGSLSDVLLFLRFAKVFHDRGVKVVIQSEEKYRPLESLIRFQEYIEDVVDEPPARMPVANLRATPYLLGVGLPNLPMEKYISIDPVLVKKFKKLVNNSKFKIGLQFFCGKPVGHELNLGRNIDPEYFEGIHGGIEFYNLEYNNIQNPGKLNLIQIGDKRTFEESAAIAQNMDLVISVDTAMVNLTGAMHLPTWLLLPHPCTSFRWFMNKTRIWWYPTVRVFRQGTKRDWAEVIRDVREELDKIRSGELRV